MNETLRMKIRKQALKLVLGIPTGKVTDLEWVTETAAKFEAYLLHGRQAGKEKPS